MKNKLMMLITGLALAGSASAQGRERRGPPDFKSDTCGDFDLSDAQKAQLRDERLKFEDERIDLEAKEKHARLELMKVLSAKGSEDKAIRKAALAAAEASSKLHVAEEVQRTEVLLKVFKPEQREKASHFLMHPHGPAFGKMNHGPGGPRRFAEEDEQQPPEPVASAE